MKNKIVILFILCICLIGISCKKQITITYEYDGGIPTDETIKVGDKDLPKPQKEGFLFVGWMEDNVIVEKLDKDNYALKALWVPIFDYETIEDYDIFMQDELVYYVYFMRDGCSWCEKIKEDVLRYYYKTSINDKLERLYIINLRTDKKNSTIFRTYSEDEDYYVNGVTKWDNLYIPATPALIEITENSDERTASLVARGATTIKEKLEESSTIDDNKSKKTDIYTIGYDLDGGECDNIVTKFNKWQSVLLPMPIKEGYFFSGWVEGDTYVKDIKLKDYNIKATWVESSSVEKITEDEIFNFDGLYYIYFLKEADDNEQFLSALERYNALASYYETGKVYYVNLEECKTIYRAYTGEGESTYKVDGAKTIDDMYVSKKKSMIMINNHEASFISDSNNKTQSYLEGLINNSLSD